MVHNRYLDEVITYDKFRFLTGIHLRVGEIFRFRRELRTRAFDMVLVPSTVSTSFTSDALAWFSGAPVRVGAGSLSGVENPSGFFFNLPVDLDWSTDPHRHQTLRNLDLANGLVEPTDDLSHEMTLTPEEIAHASDFVTKLRENERPIVVLHPGAGKPPNRWPCERFVALAEHLMQVWEATILITVGPMDTDVKLLLGNTLSKKIHLIDNQAIRTVASILFFADLLVSNDTGIMHVGAAVGTPIGSLFGPTDPRQWAPLGDEFCYIRSENGDISNISLDVVMKAVAQSLERRDFLPYAH